MDNSSLIVVVAIGLLLRKLIRFHQDNKEENPSSFSPPPSSSTSSVPPPSSSRIWTHHVFPSFRGEDVRKDFFSHVQMEFQRMGITPFIDNKIKRGKYIGPELIQAIRESKIAIILLSKNYASSKWCLDELVEILKCKEEFGQTLMTIFYKVDPTDVKKQTGDFGKGFRRTCVGKTNEEIGRWKQALEKVATIAGYHSDNWDNEAAMIKKIAIDISNILNNSVPSSDFDMLVGMRAHLEKIEPMLCLESDEVRMIGIWGPPGIGKTTIARVAYYQHSNNFQLSVFMENFKATYTRPCSDDFTLKLQLQQQFLSQITNHNDMEISHLGVAQDRLKDKKVLVVLDGVDHLVQLDAMAERTSWFGPGSRIVITTQDHNLLRAHGINQIYEVGLPPIDEALQIFCTYAFRQKYPKDGFEELAEKVTRLAGKLPLGLKVMGSYFRGMSKQKWTESLPRLETSLNPDIRSVLKFSYDALDDQEQDLFLHIACLYKHKEIGRGKEHLGKKFVELSQMLNVLADKSLISLKWTSCIDMHSLFEKLGREIVRKQSIHQPGQRQFLVDRKEIREVLTSNAAGGKSVIGIYFNYGEKKLDISERAFEGMSNLQFLSIVGDCYALQLPLGLNYMSSKLQHLHWDYFPMACLPSILNLELVVEISMRQSKLEMFWEGIKLLPNLKWVNLIDSKYLKELPDFSTATNLQKLLLCYCSSLVEIPSSIGFAKNLQKLDLANCSSLSKLPSIENVTELEQLNLRGCNLLEFPSFIGNAINLQFLDLSGLSRMLEVPSTIGNATNLEELYLGNCSSLVELPLSIGNLQKLHRLILHGCSKLEVLPTNINLESLDELDLTDCSMLKSFPEISTHIRILKLTGTAIEEVPSSISSWSHLDDFHISYCGKLKGVFHASEKITILHLSDRKIQEVPSWVKRISRLRSLILKGCKNLVSLSLPQIPDSLLFVGAEGCESLERLDCSIKNPIHSLDFAKCFKLNQEARDLIIQTSNDAVLPGREVPAHFTHRATGGSLAVKLSERPLPTSVRFKACILLVYKGDDDKKRMRKAISVTCGSYKYILSPVVTEHLYTFRGETKVTSSELVLEFKLDHDDWEIRECGVVQLP